MEKNQDSPKKIELGAGGLNIITKLQRAIDTTRKEIGLLLEIESSAAAHKSNDEILVQFLDTVSQLPQYKDKPNDAKAYITSLLDHYSTDSSVFVNKAKELSQFLTNREKDLKALDTKYSTEKVVNQRATSLPMAEKS